MATPTTPEAISQMMKAAQEILDDPIESRAIHALMGWNNQFIAAMQDVDRHQYVRYYASIGHAFCEEPKTFYFARPSPSDSRWMVPGS